MKAAGDVDVIKGDRLLGKMPAIVMQVRMRKRGKIMYTVLKRKLSEAE